MNKIKSNNMRRLAQKETTTKDQDSKKKTTGNLLIPALLTIALAYLCFMTKHNPKKVEAFLRTVYDKYDEHYNSIIQGNPEFCLQQIDAEHLFSNIRKNVLNQEDALMRLEKLFSNSTANFRGVLVAGSTGVGKTLFGNQLIDFFKWKSNVKKFIWNTFTEKDTEEENDSRLNEILGHFSVCGENLILIDSLQPKDVESIVKLYIEVRNKVEEFHKEGRIVKLTILFLVTIPNYNNIQKAEYNKHIESLSTLRGLEPTFFRTFGEDEIFDCVQQIVNKEDLVLSKSTLDDILKSIDPGSGCKNVQAKIDIFKKF